MDLLHNVHYSPLLSRFLLPTPPFLLPISHRAAHVLRGLCASRLRHNVCCAVRYSHRYVPGTHYLRLLLSTFYHCGSHVPLYSCRYASCTHRIRYAFLSWFTAMPRFLFINWISAFSRFGFGLLPLALPLDRLRFLSPLFPPRWCVSSAIGSDNNVSGSGGVARKISWFGGHRTHGHQHRGSI